MSDWGLLDGGMSDGGLSDWGMPDGAMPDGAMPDGGECPSLRRIADQSRLMRLARWPAPKPLSMFTTARPEAQLDSMPSRAVRPPKDAP